MADLKTEIQKAANKVEVAESAANLIADHLASEGFTLQAGEKPKAELRVQPAANAKAATPADKKS